MRPSLGAEGGNQHRHHAAVGDPAGQGLISPRRVPVPWTAASIPDLNGRLALVTGASSGLGLETCRALASRGATVLMACRSHQRGEAARQRCFRI